MTWIYGGFSLPLTIPIWNGRGVLRMMYEVSIGGLIEIYFTSNECLFNVGL